MADKLVTRKKKPKFAKNKKKNWRKANIHEIEEHLEGQRLEERTGGLASAKADEALFVVDKALPCIDPPEKILVKNKGIKNLKLRCFQNLEPDSRIKPAQVKRSSRKNSLKRKSLPVKKQIEANYIKPTKKKAIQQSVEARLMRSQKREESSKLPYARVDLWDSNVGLESDDVDDYFMRVTKRKLPKRPDRMNKKPLDVPAVEVPPGGASYNPSVDDHQELLQRALVVEVAKRKKDARIERVTTGMFPTVDQAPTEATWLQEMSEGLFDQEGTQPAREEANDAEGVFANPRTSRNDRKQRSQRRRELQRKRQLAAKASEKLERTRGGAIYRLKSIRKDLESEAAAIEERRRQKAERRELERGKPTRIGRLRYEEPDLALKLSEELTGSLRELKPEGHLLEEHFRSLRRRCIIEPRERHKQVKKYKRKTYENKTHRELV
ncbi:PREDICTED: glioma tumor suppressor candidate region gene 2 protein-like [Priapulus caudatus]|uniref:Ribosome biogenesis protein NOP53 n=1 Tax=Priapulus caudatus TaxID=37621 RepID=A0ABM1E633_PRICU|nr:PREDICTED: glioma tumor suppressor candidate region gene 2 protein-like [Priapulus caudatus]XP_014667656.1 PREDICTED: glioma tumor suppressor candidate region gene 2 protein-like [Priapulus caudatus]